MIYPPILYCIVVAQVTALMADLSNYDAMDEIYCQCQYLFAH